MSQWDDYTVQELRVELRNRGIAPGNKRRQELIDALNNDIQEYNEAYLPNFNIRPNVPLYIQDISRINDNRDFYPLPEFEPYMVHGILANNIKITRVRRPESRYIRYTPSQIHATERQPIGYKPDRYYERSPFGTFNTKNRNFSLGTFLQHDVINVADISDEDDLLFKEGNSLQLDDEMLMIPVIRYAETKYASYFVKHSKQSPSKEFTFYYIEPESMVYLLCKNVLEIPGRDLTRQYEADFIIGAVIDNAEYLPYDIVKYAESSSITDNMWINEEIIANILYALGYDAIILTHEEIMDVRPREQSFDNLIWKKNYETYDMI